jgi:hypothetical protein
VIALALLACSAECEGPPTVEEAEATCRAEDQYPDTSRCEEGAVVACVGYFDWVWAYDADGVLVAVRSRDEETAAVEVCGPEEALTVCE